MKATPVILAAAIMLAACEPPDRCTDTFTAFVMSQNFVERALRSPSTAEFPRMTAPGVHVEAFGQCQFLIVAWVDAQNGFGATVRTPYVVEVQYLPESDRWRLVDLNL